jgi:hypothetical protein
MEVLSIPEHFVQLSQGDLLSCSHHHQISRSLAKAILPTNVTSQS